MHGEPRSPRTWTFVLFYCPVSCLLIGLLSIYIGRTGPSYVAEIFRGGLLQNILPLPGHAGFIQLPGLLLGCCSFALVTLLRGSTRPLASVTQARVFLVILIWLVTFPVNAVILSDSRGDQLATWMRLILIAAHLCLAFIATFLPIRRRPPVMRA